MSKTAILVDGGFYRKRAVSVFGYQTPKKMADELFKYCLKHVDSHLMGEDDSTLYRIFYYDCPPCDKNIFHPLLQHDVSLEKTELYSWMNEFLEELKKKRKVALRLGFLSAPSIHYNLNQKPLRKLLRGDISIVDLQENDFTLSIQQKV